MRNRLPVRSRTDGVETACDLGLTGSADGLLETAADVDVYRIELPVNAMIVGKLQYAPGDYGLRLLLPDGSTRAEVAEAGKTQQVVRADGLAPGTYYLAVFSPRGAVDPTATYTVGVSFPPSVTLTLPNGGPPATWPYVPRPGRTVRAARRGRRRYLPGAALRGASHLGILQYPRRERS